MCTHADSHTLTVARACVPPCTYAHSSYVHTRRYMHMCAYVHTGHMGTQAQPQADTRGNTGTYVCPCVVAAVGAHGFVQTHISTVTHAPAHVSMFAHTPAQATGKHSLTQVCAHGHVLVQVCTHQRERTCTHTQAWTHIPTLTPHTQAQGHRRSHTHLHVHMHTTAHTHASMCTRVHIFTERARAGHAPCPQGGLRWAHRRCPSV